MEFVGDIVSCTRCRKLHQDQTRYCPTCKAAERARHQLRKGTEAVRDTNREASRRWRAAHIERSRASCNKWSKLNPEANRRRKHTRRALYLNAFVEEIDHRKVWLRDKGICGICHQMTDEIDWHLDHILALSLGGLHSYDNVQVSHPLCNIRKGHIERWASVS